MEKRFAIIVAGGSGRRMGANTPKQFLPLAGKPVLMHTIEAFMRFDPTIDVVLVLPQPHLMTWKELVREHGYRRPHKIAIGGAARFDSVKNGLNLIPSKGVVAVHDGVRPLVSPETLKAAYETAFEKGNAIPVVPVSDSIRQIVEGGSQHVKRDYYRFVQTPQCFRTELLKRAYKQPYKSEFTDDASVVEAMGETINLVDGNPENIKLTTPVDLALAQALLS